MEIIGYHMKTIQNHIKSFEIQIKIYGTIPCGGESPLTDLRPAIIHIHILQKCVSTLQKWSLEAKNIASRISRLRKIDLFNTNFNMER